MGEAAEMMLDGLLCQTCSVLIDGDAPGYPRRCGACISGARTGNPSRKSITPKKQKTPPPGIDREQTKAFKQVIELFSQF